MSKNILIGGGTGFIGRHLASILATKGFPITNISRMPAGDNISWQTIAEKGVPKSSHAIINLAGQNFMDFSKSWTEGFKQNVRNSRINTTRIISKAIRNSTDKPNVFILVTGVGAYPPSNNEKYTEYSNPEPNDFFSQLCNEWEGAATVDPPCRLVIIRSGVVLGRNGGMIKNIFLPFWLGVGGPLGDGKQFFPWIHIEDLCRLIVFALEEENVTGVLNGVAPQIITNNQFTQAFGKALKRPTKIPVPSGVLNFLLNKERATIMTTGQAVEPKRTLEYGFTYKYSNIEDACKEFAHLIPKKQA